MSTQDILLPPAYRLVTLREVGDAFAHAKANAASEGAGTLVFVGRFDLVEFAVVLEPDEPLRQARRAFYAGMAALADALAVNAPPEKPMHIDWPDAIRIDAGLVGGGRLAWPDNADENEPPEWLVFGAQIRTVSMLEGEAGLRPLSAALEEEGFNDMTAGELVEAFSRHFMSANDTWQEQGFGAIAKEYLSRLPDRERRAARHRREWRSSCSPDGKNRRRTQKAAAGFAHAVLVRSEDERPARVKLLRTIRLDPSDTFVFERAAEPGEWAVSGAFVFSDVDPAALQGKERSAFRGGFLGVTSLGWSTLVQIVEASDEDRERLIARIVATARRTHSARPILPPRARPPKRKSPSPPRSATSRKTR